MLTNPSFDASTLPASTIDVSTGAVNHNGNDSYILRDPGGDVEDSFGEVLVTDPGNPPNFAQDVTLLRTEFTRDTDTTDTFTLDDITRVRGCGRVAG